MESQNNKSYEITLFPGSKCVIVSNGFAKVIIEQFNVSLSYEDENEDE